MSLSWVLQVWAIVRIWDFFWRLGCQLMGWLRSDPEGSFGRLTDEVVINGLMFSYRVIIWCHVWDGRNVKWQGLVGGTGFGGLYLVMGSFPHLSLYFLDPLRWAVLLCCRFSSMTLPTSQAQSNGAKQPWAETSDTVIQSKPFIP